MLVAVCQPTMRRPDASDTNAVNAVPAQVATEVRSWWNTLRCRTGRGPVAGRRPFGRSRLGPGRRGPSAPTAGGRGGRRRGSGDRPIVCGQHPAGTSRCAPLRNSFGSFLGAGFGPLSRGFSPFTKPVAVQSQRTQASPPRCEPLRLAADVNTRVCVYPRSMAKHLIDVDEDKLRAAGAEFGTTTIKNTVAEALRRATSDHARRVAESLDVLADATSPTVRTHGADCRGRHQRAQAAGADRCPRGRRAVGSCGPAWSAQHLRPGGRYSARSIDEWDQLLGALAAFQRVETTGAHVRRALQVQRLLAGRSQRGRKIPDLLVAAAAEALDVVVLHYDADFDLIAR